MKLMIFLQSRLIAALLPQIRNTLVSYNVVLRFSILLNLQQEFSQ